jgi:hypothetical protein
MKEWRSVMRYPRFVSGARKTHAVDVARTPLRTIAAVIVAALVIACVEREVSGARDGSLLSLLAPYVVSIAGVHPG